MQMCIKGAFWTTLRIIMSVCLSLLSGYCRVAKSSHKKDYASGMLGYGAVLFVFKCFGLAEPLLIGSILAVILRMFVKPNGKIPAESKRSFHGMTLMLQMCLLAYLGLVFWFILVVVMALAFDLYMIAGQRKLEIELLTKQVEYLKEQMKQLTFEGIEECLQRERSAEQKEGTEINGIEQKHNFWPKEQEEEEYEFVNAF
uniref:Uncharacterized protein n=2 Tax=Caenorhabditis japonica TaxID=281687 RepID=A0A8R1DFV3_CAEJA